MLAGAAYLGGALPRSDLKSDLPRIWAQPGGPLTLAGWLVGTGLLVAAWLLAGRSDRLTLRWVLVTTALWVAPLALAPPLGSRDVYAYACQGAVHAAGLDAYSVGPADLPCPWLDSISTIWRETPAPYGPLFVAIAAAAVRHNLWVTVGLLRVVAIAGVALAAWALPRLAREQGVSEARAAWLALATPLVGIHLIAGAHNDALMIGLTLAGLLAATRRRAVTAGALFGAAIAVKATAGVALPFALLLLVRPSVAVSRLARAGGLLALGCVLVYAAGTLLTGLSFGWIAGLRHSGDSVQWTSLPTGVGIAIGWFVPGAIGVVRTVALVVLVVTLVWLWWRARSGDALRYCGWALLAVTALAPVFHPWYWLLPLAVLAAAGVWPRWLVWTTAALAFLVVPDGYNLARATRVAGALAVVAFVVWLAVRAARLRLSARSARSASRS